MKKNTPSRLPTVSLAVAGLSSLAILIVNALPSENRRAFVFLACVGALVGMVLGVAGFVATRGEEFTRRVPAVMGIVLGGIFFLWYALIVWLSTPF